MENQVLDLRYKIIQSLGRGGFGKTYLAEDTKRPHNPKCVVKQLNPGIEDPKFLETARRLFTKESETLEKLGVHDRIPRLLANFEQDGEFYLVQEYIEGQTLGQELNPGEIWTEDRVIDLLTDCLQIIDFVHSQGVIHRDIKPDNLIRRQADNKLVLVDFGTVKEVVVSQTQAIASTVAVGTRGYMPTEQARGKPRFTSDIYALGVIAVQALTGVHPIQLQEDENGEIIWQSQAQASPKLKETVAKMVRYHFKDRHQSATEVLQDLGSLQQPAVPQTQAVKYTPTVALTSSGEAKIAVPPTSLASLDITEPESNSVINEPVISEINSTSPETNTVETKQPLTPPKDNSPSKLKEWLQSSTAKTVAAAVVIGAIATGGMYFVSSNSAKKQEQTIGETLTEVESYHEAKNYDKCLSVIQDKTTQEIGIARDDVNKWVGRCELGKAKKAADTEEYAQAIEIALKVSSKEYPNYQEVKENIDSWSERVLQQAIALYTKEGKLKEAKKAVVNTIPQSSAVKVKALDLKAEWEQEHQTNQPIIETAQKALRDNRWEKAKIEANKISDGASEYWQLQAKEIVEEVDKELASRQQTPKATPTANPTPAPIAPSYSPPRSNTSTTQRTTAPPPPPRSTPSRSTKVTKPSNSKPAVIDVCRDAPELC